MKIKGEINISPIVYTEDKNDGLIKSKIIIYKYPKRPIPEGSKKVPTWLIVLVIMFLVLLITIFVAALILKLSSKRPGLFNEDCLRRSCEKKLNLKCLNSTCTCESDRYYLKGCNMKKSIGENCNNHVNECKSDLECFNGICNCKRNFAWNGFRCTEKETFGNDCSRVPCDDSLNLVCDQSTKLCQCNTSNRFWSGTSCLIRRSLNENCIKNSDCRLDQGLNCIYGKCQCNSTYQYFDGKNSTCTSKKSSGLPCLQTNECLGDLNCSSGGFCECPNILTQYFNESSLQCTSKTLNNLPCTTSLTCRNDLGLNCILNLCQCNTTFQYWNGIICTTSTTTATTAATTTTTTATNAATATTTTATNAATATTTTATNAATTTTTTSTTTTTRTTTTTTTTTTRTTTTTTNKCFNGNGLHPDKSTNCQSYYNCEFVGTVNQRITYYSCVSGLLFDPVLKICNFASSVTC